MPQKTENRLSGNLRMHYDPFSMCGMTSSNSVIGDSVSSSIQSGIEKADFGVVIFSPQYFRKNWAQAELNGLVSREMEGLVKIFPIWHNITKGEILNKHPTFADKFALSSRISIQEIASKIAIAAGIHGESPQPELLVPPPSHPPSDLSVESLRILYDRDIMRSIDSGILEIDPFNIDNLDPASYRFTLGAVKSPGRGEIMLCDSKVEKHILNSHETIIAYTAERISLRVDNIIGKTGMLSKLIGEGVLVGGGWQVDPGFSGKLFCTLTNISGAPVDLFYGEDLLGVEFQILSLPHNVSARRFR